MAELFDKDCDIVLELETFIHCFRESVYFPRVYIVLVPSKRTAKASFYIFMTKVRTQRHINREKVRKRTTSLFKKMNELAQIADAKIYFVMNRNERFQIYKSTDQPE